MKTDPDTEVKDEEEKAWNRAEARRRTRRGHTFTFRFRNWQKGKTVLIHSTQTPPWVTKARNRRRSKMARASRKANR